MPKQAKRPDIGMQLNQKDPLVRSFLAYAHMLARYHRHRVLHLQRLGSLLQRGRRVVLVGNHAMDGRRHETEGDEYPPSPFVISTFRAFVML